MLEERFASTSWSGNTQTNKCSCKKLPEKHLEFEKEVQPFPVEKLPTECSFLAE